ncbi:hypothetical protein [Nonomuraea glycinis]|uniref:hypothetical protein n=1 Tax=Nonomuraea glycinis TaxID=2047744 RepID=UPI002E0D7526|nr:hypothetical protein OHA68_20910 [Nonomuraea glycinis]
MHRLFTTTVRQAIELVYYGAKCAGAGPAIRGSLAGGFSIGQRVQAAIDRRRAASMA